MVRRSLTLAAVACASGLAHAHDFAICAGTVDQFALSTVELSPDPVVSGQDLVVKFTGTPAEAVEAGTATLDVKLLGIKVGSVGFDVCKDMGLECPLLAGEEVTGTITYPIPSGVPSGLTADVELNVKDSAGSVITCVDIEATLAAPSTSLRLGSSAPAFTREECEYLFLSWMDEHNVAFPDPAEFVHRLNVFSDNMKSIFAHNSDKSNTYTKAANKFAHETADEFKARHLGFVRPADPVTIPRDVFSFPWSRKSELASSVDWTSEGAVTGVKDQGSCGSCWSFSTTGAIEGAYYLATGSLVSLSEQQLVSCDTNDSGCNGGLMDYAFEWIESNGGLCTEEDYPYASSSGTSPSTCSTCTVVSGTTPSKYTDVTATESALMAAVSQQPVSIAIEADQTAFQFYSSGVLTGTCGTSLDHGVLLVGYGTYEGTDYWRVKNSWGTTWGDDGFINIERGNSQSGGLCGILESASYPTL